MSQTPAFQILFVEDQVRHQKVYATAIEEGLPVSVRFAMTGNAALAAIDESGEPPDLVVLDLDIPGVSGEEVLAKLRAPDRSRYIPVIILTGSGSLEKQLELLELGADDFLEKGMAPEILIARLRAQMRHKLAMDRLERMALDRDLFAAGVLSDIGGIRGQITTICGDVRGLMEKDPVAGQHETLKLLDRLSSVASKLGAYAADVIQTVRDTSRAAAAEPQDLAAHLEWVLDVLGANAEGKPRLVFTGIKNLALVLGDANFVRLALLNVAQWAMKREGELTTPVITVTQEIKNAALDPEGRTIVSTRFGVGGPRPTPRELERTFTTQPPPPSANREDFSAAGPELGLGLSLVGKVMGKMGGRALAEARPGDEPGLEVALELPAAPAK